MASPALKTISNPTTVKSLLSWFIGMLPQEVRLEIHRLLSWTSLMMSSMLTIPTQSPNNQDSKDQLLKLISPPGLTNGNEVYLDSS